jgi:acyl-CoA reductase-like NAD-dependent aldehyde dehydrogenase
MCLGIDFKHVLHASIFSPSHVLLSAQVIPAILAGNTAVLKPSPLTPLTAVLFAQIADIAGLPPGVLNVVNGGAQVWLSGQFSQSPPPAPPQNRRSHLRAFIFRPFSWFISPLSSAHQVSSLYSAHGQVGEHLCSHPTVRMVAFTGSTAVGARIAAAAGAQCKRVALELGGKVVLCSCIDRFPLC